MDADGYYKKYSSSSMSSSRDRLYSTSGGNAGIVHHHIPHGTYGSSSSSASNSNVRNLSSSRPSPQRMSYGQHDPSMNYDAPSVPPPLPSPTMDQSIDYHYSSATHHQPQSHHASAPSHHHIQAPVVPPAPMQTSLEKYFTTEELKRFNEYNRLLIMSSPGRQKKFYASLTSVEYKRFTDYLDMEAKSKTIPPPPVISTPHHYQQSSSSIQTPSSSSSSLNAVHLDPNQSSTPSYNYSSSTYYGSNMNHNHNGNNEIESSTNNNHLSSRNSMHPMSKQYSGVHSTPMMHQTQQHQQQPPPPPMPQPSHNTYVSTSIKDYYVRNFQDPSQAPYNAYQDDVNNNNYPRDGYMAASTTTTTTTMASEYHGRVDADNDDRRPRGGRRRGVRYRGGVGGSNSRYEHESKTRSRSRSPLPDNERLHGKSSSSRTSPKRNSRPKMNSRPRTPSTNADRKRKPLPARKPIVSSEKRSPIKAKEADHEMNKVRVLEDRIKQLEKRLEFDQRKFEEEKKMRVSSRSIDSVDRSDRSLDRNSTANKSCSSGVKPKIAAKPSSTAGKTSTSKPVEKKEVPRTVQKTNANRNQEEAPKKSDSAKPVVVAKKISSPVKVKPKPETPVVAPKPSSSSTVRHSVAKVSDSKSNTNVKTPNKAIVGSSSSEIRSRKESTVSSSKSRTLSPTKPYERMRTPPRRAQRPSSPPPKPFYSRVTDEDIENELPYYQWCNLCRLFYDSPMEYLLHVHRDRHYCHLGNSDFSIIKKAEDKIDADCNQQQVLKHSSSNSSANTDLSMISSQADSINGAGGDGGGDTREQFSGTEFLYPLISFYCDLCAKFLSTTTQAKEHLSSEKHLLLYEKYTKKNNVFYKKFNEERLFAFKKSPFMRRLIINKNLEKQRHIDLIKKQKLAKIQAEQDKREIRRVLDSILDRVCRNQSNLDLKPRKSDGGSGGRSSGLDQMANKKQSETTLSTSSKNIPVVESKPTPKKPSAKGSNKMDPPKSEPSKNSTGDDVKQKALKRKIDEDDQADHAMVKKKPVPNKKIVETKEPDVKGDGPKPKVAVVKKKNVKPEEKSAKKVTKKTGTSENVAKQVPLDPEQDKIQDMNGDHAKPMSAANQTMMMMVSAPPRRKAAAAAAASIIAQTNILARVPRIKKMADKKSEAKSVKAAEKKMVEQKKQNQIQDALEDEDSNTDNNEMESQEEEEEEAKLGSTTEDDDEDVDADEAEEEEHEEEEEGFDVIDEI